MMVMKGCMQCRHVSGEIILLSVGFEPGPLSKQAGALPVFTDLVIYGISVSWHFGS